MMTDEGGVIARFQVYSDLVHAQSLKQNKKLSVTFFYRSDFFKSYCIICVFQAFHFLKPSWFSLKWIH